jgi:hypothetical protein
MTTLTNQFNSRWNSSTIGMCEVAGLYVETVRTPQPELLDGQWHWFSSVVSRQGEITYWCSYLTRDAARIGHAEICTEAAMGAWRGSK